MESKKIIKVPALSQNHYICEYCKKYRKIEYIVKYIKNDEGLDYAYICRECAVLDGI